MQSGHLTTDATRDARNRALGERARRGDHEARALLIEENQSLAGNLAKRWAMKRKKPYDETLSNAFMGLVLAVDGYDPSVAAFSTYAAFRIQGELIRGFGGSLVAVPILTGKQKTTGVVPFQSEKDRARRPSFPLDASERSLFCRSPNPSDAAEDRDLIDSLPRYLARLGPIHRRVVCLRFGLDGEGEREFKQIGDELGVSRETVRTRVREGLAELRAMMKDAG